ncbi:MAG: hypothetical protein MUO26_14195 [Methanotrichaceae archaeon]|nr:hypothetical protein [Methanotrichaceae archaeon]
MKRKIAENPKYEAPKIISLETMRITEGQSPCMDGGSPHSTCKNGTLAHSNCRDGSTPEDPTECIGGEVVKAGDCGYGIYGGAACNDGYNPVTSCVSGNTPAA